MTNGRTQRRWGPDRVWVRGSGARTRGARRCCCSAVRRGGTRSPSRCFACGTRMAGRGRVARSEGTTRRSSLVRGNGVAAAVTGRGGRAPKNRGRGAPFFSCCFFSSTAVTSLPPTVAGGRPGATARDPVDRRTGRPGQRAACPGSARSPRVRGAPAPATAASRLRRTVPCVERSFRAAPCNMR